MICADIQNIESTIKAVNEGMELDLSAGLKKEQTAFMKIFSSSDVYEGLLAFIEKRSPKFIGK